MDLFKLNLSLRLFFNNFNINCHKRRRLRLILKNKISKIDFKKQKWGVSYSVFDGEELLESSLLAIRNSVDYINVVFQRKSWYGEDASCDLIKTLNDLKSKGLIDEMFEYIPNPEIPAGGQERKKRMIGLNAAQKANVTYFMTMDCDEFYIKKELDFAKKCLIKNKIDYSFCNIINYGFSPNRRIIAPTPSFIQFFSKINKRSKLGENPNIITLVDPTRILVNPKIFLWLKKLKYYFLPGVEMHHMTLIRKNVIRKMNNSSCALNLGKKESDLQDVDNLTILSPDIFNLLPIVESFKGDENERI